MANIQQFEAHAERYESWFERYPAVFDSEVLAIKEHFRRLPDKVQGIEVGLGTGRFTMAFGIREGVEPAGAMREIALKKGLEVMDARAEHLPYKDLRFDFVMFVTICHLDDAERAFREAHRVLARKGMLIVGFIDKNSTIGMEYEAGKAESTFFKASRFYGVQDVQDLLKKCHFGHLEINQTLFGSMDEIDEVQMPREGHGEGSFVVISAKKK